MLWSECALNQVTDRFFVILFFIQTTQLLRSFQFTTRKGCSKVQNSSYSQLLNIAEDGADLADTGLTLCYVIDKPINRSRDRVVHLLFYENKLRFSLYFSRNFMFLWRCRTTFCISRILRIPLAVQLFLLEFLSFLLSFFTWFYTLIRYIPQSCFALFYYLFLFSKFFYLYLMVPT